MPGENEVEDEEWDDDEDSEGELLFDDDEEAEAAEFRRKVAMFERAVSGLAPGALLRARSKASAKRGE